MNDFATHSMRMPVLNQLSQDTRVELGNLQTVEFIKNNIKSGSLRVSTPASIIIKSTDRIDTHLVTFSE